uniref:Olduvai domain-containing protein n=1 Tax=Stegastes partitus TaxID=144197 RepID=A0A3B5BBK3_9TELE
EGLREQATRLRSDLALSHQENRELQERLMVSEATVHAQAEQLKDYRDLLSESCLSYDSKPLVLRKHDTISTTTTPCGCSSSSLSRKYNTLIQAQARELSHLRQRMREGQGVCHILTQHLGDTTKAFEELLRANDIDYYMGQSFREQLAQSTALAQRVVTKISGRKEHLRITVKHTESDFAFSLQQKDKIIESLHTKLQQRPETPSSCHALSETTDQSDRTSLVSDEYQTNEDLELCSDLDAREYHEEHRLRQTGLGSEPDGIVAFNLSFCL